MSLQPYLARHWHVTRNNKVQCDLCPRGCKLNEGQRGFCYIRQNQGGSMTLETYGFTSGFQMDPIEKKPLNQFLPGSRVLSFGQPGCNLGCKFCQNWDLTKAKDHHRALVAASPQEIAQLARNQGARSVALTYNDPVTSLEFGFDVGAACHEAGVKLVLVTAGYLNPEAYGEFFKYADAANVDIKGFSEDFYRRLCQGRLQPVLDSLLYAREFTNCWLEITHLLIPGQNDNPQETKALCKWVYDYLGPQTPIHFSAFHPDYQITQLPPTPPATLRRAWEIAQEVGLRYPYTGNVHDAAGDATHCPHCHQVVIQRDWFRILEINLKGNTCAFCGGTVDGVFA